MVGAIPDVEAATLADLGWSEKLATAFGPHAILGRRPGRIVVEHRGGYGVWTLVAGRATESSATVSGRYRFEAGGPVDFPAVGDWVAIDGSPADGALTIHAVLPRRSAFARLAAGRRTEEQVVAANIDVVFVAMAFDGDFNLRRLERYLAVAGRSGATPVILLTKADRVSQSEVDDRRIEVEATAPGTDVLVVSALAAVGLEAVGKMLPSGRTGVVLGSSGVGKSTLINALLGHELLPTGGIREDDDRGRHTTVQRQLIVLPSGGMLIDTPGMREVGLWEGGEALEETFGEIDALAEACRFRDCRHEREPGCAVQAAIDAGALSADRLRSRRKLEREAAATEARHTPKARAEARRFARVTRKAAFDSMARKSTLDGESG
jgi:ribosome biogenesis GTPase